MIICEFNYCIYNKKSRCLLKIISISPLEMCDRCIILNINKAMLLEKYKKGSLENLEPIITKKKE